MELRWLRDWKIVVSLACIAVLILTRMEYGHYLSFDYFLEEPILAFALGVVWCITTLLEVLVKLLFVGAVLQFVAFCYRRVARLLLAIETKLVGR